MGNKLKNIPLSAELVMFDDIDDIISRTSVNPISNRAVYAALSNYYLKNETSSAAELSDAFKNIDMSEFLSKKDGGNVSGDISVLNKTTTKQIDVKSKSSQPNVEYTEDSYIACGFGNTIGFMYFPWGFLTIDKENSIISVNCQTSELKNRMISEACGLKYSVDSQHGGINIGTVMDVLPAEDQNIVGLSVDNIQSGGSPIGIFFIEKPTLGFSKLGYNQDYGGLVVGSDCKVHCCGAVAEGTMTKAAGRYSHAEGYQTTADWGCHVEGRYNEALGIINHVEGYSNKVDNKTGKPEAVHVEGIFNLASGKIDAVHVGGTCAKGTDSFSYTWNGVVGDVMDPEGNISSGNAACRAAKFFIPVSPYNSHGQGTFSINPVGLENGFWIGEKTLADIIDQRIQPVFDLLDFTFNGDIFVTQEGRKYVPADQLENVFIYPDEDRAALTDILKFSSIHTSFGNGALQDCVNLTDLDIPEGVSSLGSNSIRNCQKLSSLNMPHSLVYIGDGALSGCISLTDLDIPEGVSSLGSNSIRNCSNLSSINLPNSLVKLESNCFRSNNAITSITLPSGLLSIGQYGVGHMDGITTLSVPDSVITLTAGAFGANSNLTSINFPQNVTEYLSANVFFNDYSLKEISAYSFRCSDLSTMIQKWMGTTSKAMSQVSVFGQDGTMIFDKTATPIEYTFNYIFN